MQLEPPKTKYGWGKHWWPTDYINQKKHKSEEHYIDDSKDHWSLERIVMGDNHLKYAWTILNIRNKDFTSNKRSYLAKSLYFFCHPQRNHSVPHTYSETTTCLAPKLKLCMNSRPNQSFRIKIGEDKDTILVDDLKLSRTIPQNRIGICRRSSFKFWAHPYLSKIKQKLCPPSNIAGWWYTYPSEIYQSVGVMKFPNWMESHERHVHHQPDSNGKSSNNQYHPF